MARSVLRDVLVILFFVCLTLLVTYPVARHMDNAIPGDPGDPLFVASIMGWNYHTLFAGSPSGYWNFNIFYPMKRALTLADHFFFVSLMGFPVYWFSENLLLAYNFVFLLSFVLTGYAVFRLALFVVPNVTAALFAGIAFAFTTYRINHCTQLNLLQTQWAVFALLALFAFARRRKALAAVGLALALIANALSTMYYLVFMALILAFLLPVVLAGAGNVRDRKLWIGFALVGIVFLAATSPFILPYLKANPDAHRERAREEITQLSMKAESFVAGCYLPRRLTPWLSKIHTHEPLFPGFLPILFGLGCLFYPRNLRAAWGWFNDIFSLRPEWRCRFLFSAGLLACGASFAGLIAARAFGAYVPIRKICYAALLLLPLLFGLSLCRWERTRGLLRRYFLPRTTYRGLFLFMIIVAILLAFGPTFYILGERAFRGPYYYFQKYVPGLGQLRAIGRLGFFAVLGLCILAAYGIADLERALRHRRRLRWAVRGVLLTGIVLESLTYTFPISRVPTREEIAPVYHWVAEQEEELVLAELPMGWVFDEAWYMYCSTVHWRSRVNGYSAFCPKWFGEMVVSLNQFPGADSVERMKRMGVDYVVFHGSRAQRPPPPESGPGFSRVRQFGDDYVYEIVPP